MAIENRVPAGAGTHSAAGNGEQETPDAECTAGDEPSRKWRGARVPFPEQKNESTELIDKFPAPEKGKEKAKEEKKLPDELKKVWFRIEKGEDKKGAQSMFARFYSKMVDGATYLHVSEECLGRGGFGQVNVGRLTSDDGEEVAVKFAKYDEKTGSKSAIARECEIYDAIGDVEWLPRLHCHGHHKDIDLMVMKKLGDNLGKTREKDPELFQEKFAVYATNAIKVLMELHKKGFVHGDVKPENFVLCNPKETNDNLFLIDLGLASRWDEDGDHVKYYQQPTIFRGTRRYASVHAHLGRKCSRRDDLESLAYTLLFLVCGRLPWQKPEAKVSPSGQAIDESKNDKKDKEKENFEIYKDKTTKYGPYLNEYCPERFRSVVMRFLEYAVNLRFDEEPNYDFLAGDPLNFPTNTHGTLSNKWISICDPCRAMKQRYHYNVNETFLSRYIAKDKEEKLWISSIGSHKNLWALVTKESVEISDQRYKVFENFMEEDQWIEDQRNENYYISALAGLDDGCCLVVVSKGLQYSQQFYKISDYFPAKLVDGHWSQGFLVTAMGTIKDKWVVVMSKSKGFSEEIKQVIELDFYFPSEGIHHRWKDGYTITLVAASNYQVACIMNPPKKRPAEIEENSSKKKPAEGKQKAYLTSAFPRDAIKSGWLSKRYVTSLCHGQTFT